MEELKAVNLGLTMDRIARDPVPISVLWAGEESLAFVARGRADRREFHVDPADEVMYMLKGDMNLHYRTPEGEEKLVVLREGEVVYCPAGTPHSPRFSPDSFVLILERNRRAGEDDRFQWFCERCGTQLYEAVRHVEDYGQDPITKVYNEFYGTESHRTCSNCGQVMERPS